MKPHGSVAGSVSDPSGIKPGDATPHLTNPTAQR